MSNQNNNDVRRLTDEEIHALREEMKEASEYMRAELKRRKKARADQED